MPGKHLNSLEKQSFCDLGSEITARRICGDPLSPPVPVTGKFSLAAPGPMLPTGDTVGDVSAEFPAVNQIGRAAFSIRNVSITGENMYIVRATGVSLAASLPHKWTIGPNESINTDFDDTNKVTLVSEAGKSVPIEILEIKGP